jgi:hypothetical protein
MEGLSTHVGHSLDHSGVPPERQVSRTRPGRPAAIRAEGLDPDDPAVIAAIDLVRWGLSLLQAAEADLLERPSDAP